MRIYLNYTSITSLSSRAAHTEQGRRSGYTTQRVTAQTPENLKFSARECAALRSPAVPRIQSAAARRMPIG